MKPLYSMSATLSNLFSQAKIFIFTNSFLQTCFPNFQILVFQTFVFQNSCVTNFYFLNYCVSNFYFPKFLFSKSLFSKICISNFHFIKFLCSKFSFFAFLCSKFLFSQILFFKFHFFELLCLKFEICFWKFLFFFKSEVLECVIIAPLLFVLVAKFLNIFFKWKGHKNEGINSYTFLQLTYALWTDWTKLRTFELKRSLEKLSLENIYYWKIAKWDVCFLEIPKRKHAIYMLAKIKQTIWETLSNLVKSINRFISWITVFFSLLRLFWDFKKKYFLNILTF